MLFENLNLIEPLLRALKSEGYTKPTPIQAQAIPTLLERQDLLGCAQTGTGKTAAFTLPILQLLHQDELFVKGPHGIKALILTPTRELAIQIGESFAAYGKYLRISHTVIFGGVSQYTQTQALRSGVDVLIATPGRLLDLINQRHVKLQNLKMLVLDEADRMLDMGFIHDVKKIITHIPEKRQTIFFSATMPPEIALLANTILKNPKRVEVTPVASTANTIQQAIYFVEKGNKRKLLHYLLEDKNIKTALVFTRTKHGADRVAKDLNTAGIRAEAIHGNKSQNARQNALKNFKAQKTRVLVATDIAARGIDIDELSHVINFELPNVPETYVHRIGRTGRAGASGISISFCDGEEQEYLRDIQKLIGKTIPVISDHPYPLTHAHTSRVSPPLRQPKQKTSFSRNNHSSRNNQRRNDSQRGDSIKQPRESSGSPKSTAHSAQKRNAAPNRHSGGSNSNGRSSSRNSGQSRWGSENRESNY